MSAHEMVCNIAGDNGKTSWRRVGRPYCLRCGAHAPGESLGSDYLAWINTCPGPEGAPVDALQDVFGGMP